MQEFLTNNTVNCNLMSLTGYRTLVILEALMESPKTNDEINNCLFQNQYIKEKFSSDTLRIYINSLRAIGCEITSANKTNDKKYKLVSHPFDYDIPQSQLKAFAKLYKSFCSKIEIKEILIIEDFLKKLSRLVKNPYTKEFLSNISVVPGVNKEILNNLIIHCKNKNQITFLYNSPKSGKKEIEVIADKLAFKSDRNSDRLYFWGHSITHKEYAFFAPERILKINSIKFRRDTEEFPTIKVVYELYNNNENYIPEKDERIIGKSDDKLIIETFSDNEFSLMQRILYFAQDCKVISPVGFQEKLLAKLNTMGKNYENV